MKKQLYLAAMEKVYPQEYSEYIDALKTMNIRKSWEVIDRIYKLMSDDDKVTAFGIKLSLDYAVLSYHMGEKEKALRLGTKSLKLAGKTEDRDMVADAEYVLGWLLVREHRVGSALQYLKKCIVSAEKLGIVQLAAWAAAEIAQCARENFDIQYELEQLLKAYKLAKKTRDMVLELHVLTSISTLYNDINDLKESLNYMETAINMLKYIKENNQMNSGLSGTVNTLEPQIIVRYAFICYRHGKHDELLAIAAQIKEKPVENYTVNPRKVIYLAASLCLFEQAKSEAALEYVEMGITEETRYFERPYYDIVFLTYRLMDCMLEIGKKDYALKLIEFTVETVINQGSLSDLRLSWRMYSKYYGVIGDSEKKTEALEKYMECMEAYNAEKSEQLSRGIRNQIKLDEEAKRREKQKLRQEMKLSEVQAEREAAEYMSDHDTLTGLFTRNKLKKDREGELFQYMTSCGIIFFDVNDLKMTNDVYGHEAGDILLRNAAKSLSNLCDERYYAYRMGGDEFMLVICNCKDYELDMVLEKWHAELMRLNEEADIKCVVAAGCAYGSGDFNIETLMRKADERMYENKRTMKCREHRTEKVNESVY